MSIKAQRIECRYLSTNRSSHQSKNARIKTITNMAQLFGNLTLVSMAMILLAVSGANGAPDPTTLEEAQGSYTNRDSEDTFPPFALSTMSDDEDMERTRRKRGMGQDSGFVRFGKRMSSEGDYIDDGMTDSRQFNEVNYEDQFDRGVRSQSGFVRFGKRKIPGGFTHKMGKRPVPGGFANKMGKRVSIVEDTLGETVKRGSSGFVRFGKRMPGSDMRFGKRDGPGAMKVGSSYSECVAKTVAQAVDRTDLLNLLVANGCIRRRMPLQQNYVQVRLN